MLNAKLFRASYQLEAILLASVMWRHMFEEASFGEPVATFFLVPKSACNGGTLIYMLQIAVSSERIWPCTHVLYNPQGWILALLCLMEKDASSWSLLLLVLPGVNSRFAS